MAGCQPWLIGIIWKKLDDSEQADKFRRVSGGIHMSNLAEGLL
jgi:hypothetical protein